MQIEGIPDGWELVRIGVVYPGEFYVDASGKPRAWADGSCSEYDNCVIIRKKPKRYRHFANAAEADELWNAVLKYKNPEPVHEDDRFRVTFIRSDRVGVGTLTFTYQKAFELFEVSDGTPFGVEVVE